MGVLYNAGRGLIVAGIITLLEAALVFSKYLPGDPNLLGEYSYLFLLAGVVVIAISTKIDFLEHRGEVGKEGAEPDKSGSEVKEDKNDGS